MEERCFSSLAAPANISSASLALLRFCALYSTNSLARGMGFTRGFKPIRLHFKIWGVRSVVSVLCHVIKNGSSKAKFGFCYQERGDAAKNKTTHVYYKAL